MREMKLLGDTINIRDDYRNINELKFLKDNPRVYACTHGQEGFKDLSDEEQQEKIYENLLNQPSVKNLIPEIKRHGGLMESILVRWDTKQVIEGNSRLAVYRKLYEDSGTDKQDEWELIPCDIIDSLTEPQQAAYLSQIHVKGKTDWSAYEKANFSYVRYDDGDGMSYAEIAELFNESEVTIRTRIKVIQMMKKNNDSKQSHFSYYDVLVRYPNIKKGMVEAKGWKKLLTDIKSLGEEEQDNKFTAQDLRNKMPVVLKKPRVLKKYIAEEIDLDEAYQRAKISGVEDNVKKAMTLLDDVSADEVKKLENNRFNAFEQAVKNLVRKAQRIKDMTKKIGDGR